MMNTVTFTERCADTCAKGYLTVRELKQLIKDWPEETNMGEETEVWIDIGGNLSRICTEVSALNYRKDGEREWADIILGSES